MSDTSNNLGFGKFVPGFDFLQSLAKGASSSIPQLPNLSNWVAPTISVEELEKRVEELKAVQFWLEQNSRALSATIQALEVQKMTLATLKGMNFSMGDVANAFKLKTADTVMDGVPVYEARLAMGELLAEKVKQSIPVEEIDVVIPIPDSSRPSAMELAQALGIPFREGFVKNRYVGRTFIEPTDSIRHLGVRLKHNPNREKIKGQRVVLVDDSIVRGTTSRKIVEMIRDAGAAEVHFRIASPPTAWPCFYGVDTPERSKLLAANMSEDEMRDWIGVDSLKFVTLDGLYRAAGEAAGRDAKSPRFCDACFSGDYPVVPSDKIEEGFQMKAAE